MSIVFGFTIEFLCDRQALPWSVTFDYMHFNPVRRGLVMSPEERRWASVG
jgi:hypothetical protein